MDLRDLLTVLRARWKITTALAVLGAIVGLAISLISTPVYESRLQFYATVAGGDSAAAAYQGSLGAQQRVQSYAALAKSSEIAERVAESSGTSRGPSEVSKGVEASADAKTVLLTVSVADSDPAEALKIARGYADVLPTVVNEIETPDGGGPALAKLTVVSPPELATDPVAPKTAQNVVLGLVAGLVVGFAGALLINALDRRTKSKEQLERLTGSPVVGSIPFRRREDRDTDAEHIVPFRQGHSPAAEAFRRLRTNLQFLNVDNPPKLFVVTSSVTVEGKSETAVNLSLALAEAGNRTLLIEADLRRPRVVNYMRMPDKVGLTNILSGQADFEDVVQRTVYDGVDLLACGPLPPNPSELLASEVANKLLAELRGRYDYVIIDSPPLLPVTDGALLARITDGAMLVVRLDRTTTDQVAIAVDDLRKADAQLLGVITVANKPVKRGTNGYYDSYYYSSKVSSDGQAK